MLSPLTAGGIKCERTGRGLWELGPSFSCMSSYVPFPMADSTLYLSAVITLNHNCVYMLSPVSSSSESSNLGVLETPDT